MLAVFIAKISTASPKFMCKDVANQRSNKSWNIEMKISGCSLPTNICIHLLVVDCVTCAAGDHHPLVCILQSTVQIYISERYPTIYLDKDKYVCYWYHVTDRQMENYRGGRG